jgi:NAD(P)-dependent dehydrogenase (short-subunit alcohol dehydrogenase family)
VDHTIDAEEYAMPLMCEGRVVVVTGAGRGIGREYALMLAQQGAKVVVNDLGASRDGTGANSGPDAAGEVVEEIRALGGDAIVNGGDVSDFDEAKALIQQAIDVYGELHALVNNAGIIRDRMLTNMTEAEWDSVIKVHLKGTFGPTRHAASYWRDRAKSGSAVDARIINTTSAAGLYGNPGQINYGVAKQGIASFTFTAALELERFGITVNAIAPGALTRMTANLGVVQESEDLQRSLDPRWVAPMCTWLVSEQSAGITGRVFEASGQGIAVAEGWHRGPHAPAVGDPADVDGIVRGLLAQTRAPAGIDGRDLAGWEGR